MIHVTNLTKVYRTKVQKPGLLPAVKALFHNEQSFRLAIDSLTFQIESGELVGILGPNGAGKTTLLKILSGLLYPTEGQVSVLGYTPWHRQKKL